MPRAKQRNDELRVRILETALEVLADGGPASVTTRRVSERAATSPPAIYELFDGKTGLVRALFFEGFRRLDAAVRALPTTGDPVADLVDTVGAFRQFAVANAPLFGVMYSRSFGTFAPSPEERKIGDRTRRSIIDRVDRCIASGRLVGDPKDIAHVLLATSVGLATQEIEGWLGRTPAARDRRWRRAIDALVRGFGPPSVR